jgi:AcrR family transcriptional regulator
MMENSTTRERILNAARERFTHRGFANTAVREICEDAGVTAPVLYYHFGSKAGVFQAVTEDALNLCGFCDFMRQEVAARPGAWEKLRTFAYLYLTTFPIHTLNPGLHFTDSTRLADDSLRRLTYGIEATYQLAKEILESGIADGTFREVKADTVAACLLGTVDSFVRSHAYLGVEYDMDEIAACLVDLFLDGLRAR